jgi:hypothetical protein
MNKPTETSRDWDPDSLKSETLHPKSLIIFTTLFISRRLLKGKASGAASPS